jgi:hypothetical protein
MSPYAGGGGGGFAGSQPKSTVQLYTGAQIHFGDLTSYLTHMAFPLLFQQLASSPFFIAVITVLRGVPTWVADSDPHYY